MKKTCKNCANRRTPKCGVCVVAPSAQGSADKSPSRWEPDDQAIKADAGKPRLSLVPTQIIRDIAEVREYGVAKYGDTDSWRRVELDRYKDALLRHIIAMWDDIKAVDAESGMEHYKHAECNLAFISEILAGVGNDQEL